MSYLNLELFLTFSSIFSPVFSRRIRSILVNFLLYSELNRRDRLIDGFRYGSQDNFCSPRYPGKGVG